MSMYNSDLCTLVSEKGWIDDRWVPQGAKMVTSDKFNERRIWYEIFGF